MFEIWWDIGGFFSCIPLQFPTGMLDKKQFKVALSFSKD
jgi:hypothetical protein